MPSQQPKRYSIRAWFKGKLETEYYVEKYIHAYTIAQMLKDSGSDVHILDNKTGRTHAIPKRS